MTGSGRAASSVLLVLLFLSGCMGSSPPGGSSSTSTTSPTTASHTATQTTPPVASFSVLNFTAAADRAHYGVEITVEVLQNLTALSFTAANQRRQDPTGGPMDPTTNHEVGRACGSIDMNQTRDGEPVLAWGAQWAESRGHFAFISTGEEPTVIEDGTSPESLVGVENFTWTISPIEARAGDLLQVRMARDNQGRVFEPYTLLEAEHPALRVVGQKEVAFTCGANLQDFRGTVVQQGMTLGSVIGRDLELSGTTAHGTDIRFVLLVPYGGSCHVLVEALGVVLDDSGLQVGHEHVGCLAAGQSAPGPYRLLIPEVAGTGPALLYFIWDVA